MNWTYFEPEKHTRNDLMSVWIKHSEYHQHWIVQVCVRGMRGIYYLEDAYEGHEPTPEILVRDARMRGIFSARPSYIWQPYDYSMTYCARCFTTGADHESLSLLLWWSRHIRQHVVARSWIFV